MTTSGNFGRIFINGYEVTGDMTNIHYTHAYKPNKVMAQNVGVNQVAPGSFAPSYDFSAYARRGISLQTAYNLLFPSGPGNVNANDTEYIITAILGHNQSPQQGDSCVLFDGTRLQFDRSDNVASNSVQMLNSSFKPRGKRQPFMPPLQYINEAFKTATNISSTPYDDGAETSAGTTLGAVAQLQVYSPTGALATGSISLTGQPSDADAFTINIGGTAYTYTFKTALTPTAGQVLIGASVAATALNLWYAIVGEASQAGTAYATGTTPIDQRLATSPLFAKVPSATQVISLQAANAQSGTTGNSITLVASPNVSAKLVVSAATMTGGVAGDTYNVVVASSTSSGGSYTTLATFSGVGAVNTAQRIEVPIGTTINEWIKVTTTLANGAGTSQTMGFNVVFGRWFQA